MKQNQPQCNVFHPFVRVNSNGGRLNRRVEPVANQAVVVTVTLEYLQKHIHIYMLLSFLNTPYFIIFNRLVNIKETKLEKKL